MIPKHMPNCALFSNAAPVPRLALPPIAAITAREPLPAEGPRAVDIAALRDQNPDHWMKACAIRALTLDAVAAANSGHSGMPMGMADIATVLFEKHLKFDAAAPDWPDRDRFVVSNGHGSMLLYALLHLTGYADMTMDEIRNFRQWGAKTAGHPEYGHAKGIETTTGPLGQGIGNAVGMAMAEAHLRSVWGKKLVDHRTWVFAGDGCLMEGISHEAIGLAGHQQLDRLTVFFDDNDITIDGPVSLTDRTDQMKRFKASGWAVFEVDGHDPAAIDEAIGAAKGAGKPVLLACKTHIALGSSAQDTAKGHGALTDPDLIAETKKAYGWPYAAFEVPADIKTSWEETGRRGRAEREAWEGRLADLSANKRERFLRTQAWEPAKKLTGVVRALKKQISETAPKVATRKASEMALEVINPVMTETFGGSADLSGSNNTKTSDMGLFTSESRKGRYVHYGIREHGMAAAMNGIALHGGLRPYGGTFMVFTDYARPASAALGADGRSGGLCDDPRFHRPRRRRPDPSAGRTPRHAARHAEPAGDPPRRRGRDRRSVGDRALHHGPAHRAGADPPGRGHRAHGAQAEEPDRAGRLCAGRGRGQAAGDPDRHRLRGGNRPCRPRQAAGRRHRHPRRVDALLGALRGAGRGLSPPGAAGRIGARRGRGMARQSRNQRAGSGRIGRNVLRAAHRNGPHRYRGGRDQRSRPGRDQRAPAALRQRAWPLPRAR
jgi:transketolase N-terminal domain/subunit